MHIFKSCTCLTCDTSANNTLKSSSIPSRPPHRAGSQWLTPSSSCTCPPLQCSDVKGVWHPTPLNCRAVSFQGPGQAPRGRTCVPPPRISCALPFQPTSTLSVRLQRAVHGRVPHRCNVHGGARSQEPLVSVDGRGTDLDGGPERVPAHEGGGAAGLQLRRTDLQRWQAVAPHHHDVLAPRVCGLPEVVGYGEVERAHKHNAGVGCLCPCSGAAACARGHCSKALGQ